MAEFCNMNFGTPVFLCVKRHFPSILSWMDFRRELFTKREGAIFTISC